MELALGVCGLAALALAIFNRPSRTEIPPRVAWLHPGEAVVSSREELEAFLATRRRPFDWAHRIPWLSFGGPGARRPQRWPEEKPRSAPTSSPAA